MVDTDIKPPASVTPMNDQVLGGYLERVRDVIRPGDVYATVYYVAFVLDEVEALILPSSTESAPSRASLDWSGVPPELRTTGDNLAGFRSRIMTFDEPPSERGIEDYVTAVETYIRALNTWASTVA